MASEADFDRYIAEHNIPEEEWPEAFARWIAERRVYETARTRKSACPSRPTIVRSA